MLSPRSIFQEIKQNDEAFRLLAGTASKNELQGGWWENERIAALTRDPVLAAKIRRHGADKPSTAGCSQLFYAATAWNYPRCQTTAITACCSNARESACRTPV